MKSPIRAVEEARASLEGLGSRDPDALDALCRRLARAPLAMAALGSVSAAGAGVGFAWARAPLLLLLLGLGAAVALRGVRSLRAIARARREFLRRHPAIEGSRAAPLDAT